MNSYNKTKVQKKGKTNMAGLIYTFKIKFKDDKRKESICGLFEKDKMQYKKVSDKEISFETGEHELARYMKKIEQVCGDPDYLMDLEAIWGYKSAKEIHLIGAPAH